MKYFEIEIEFPYEKPNADFIVYDVDNLRIREDELTCFTCECRKDCDFVDDPYNTDGDCLALK